MATVMERIKEREHEFNFQIIEPLVRVWSYSHELDLATQGKAFRISNPLVWEVMLSARDAVILDAASWAAALYARDGFWRTLSATDLSSLASPERPEDGAPVRVKRESFQARQASYKRLFPTASGRWAAKGDISAVCTRLESLTKDLLSQRHARAHLFDGAPQRAKYGEPRMVSFNELSTILTHLREMLYDLRLLADNSEYGFNRLGPETDNQHARDLVDLTLFGTVSWMTEEWKTTPMRPGEQPREYLWQHREAYYAYLHARHDHGAPEGVLFNDLAVDTDDFGDHQQTEQPSGMAP